MTDAPDKPEDETAEDQAAEPATSATTDASTNEDALRDAEPAKSAGDIAPKKKKKAKKSAGPEKVEVNDDSPEARRLAEAQVAFEVGDYKTARAIAGELVGHSHPNIADGARDLLRRTDVDPAQMIFLAACACALIGVAFYYLR